MKFIKQVSVIFPFLAVLLVISGAFCLAFSKVNSVEQSVDNITLTSADGTYGLYSVEVEAGREYCATFRASGNGDIQLYTDLYAGPDYDSAENDHYITADGTVSNVKFSPYDSSEPTSIRFILTGNGSAEITDISLSYISGASGNDFVTITGVLCIIFAVCLVAAFFVVRKLTADIQLPEKKNIVFIGKLRGIAALLVVVSHLLIFYTSNVSAIFPWIIEKTDNVYANDTVRIEDILLQFMEKSTINFGAFGVSVFFLITGFCMMITLGRHKTVTVREFLSKKILRLYPVYIVGFVIGVIVSVCYASKFGTGFNYTLTQCVMQITLLGRLFGFASIDGLVWTLEVQLVFYVLAYVLYRARLLEKPSQIMGTALVMMICKFVFANINAAAFIALADMITYIYPMFAGICIYYYYSDKWSAGEALGLTALICAACGVGNVAPSSYYLGFIVFVVFMFMDKKGSLKISALLSFISKISYPLYASHALVSYNLLSYLNYKGIYPTSASLIVLSADIILAVIIHYCVEGPLEKLIARISSKAA